MATVRITHDIATEVERAVRIRLRAITDRLICEFEKKLREEAISFTCAFIDELRIQSNMPILSQGIDIVIHLPELKHEEK